MASRVGHRCTQRWRDVERLTPTAVCSWRRRNISRAVRIGYQGATGAIRGLQAPTTSA